MKKIISFFEVCVMVISIIAFAYFVADFSTKKVYAASSSTGNTEDLSGVGCCMETIVGSICQDVSKLEKDFCKENLLSTTCDRVNECQSGCCYSADSGMCALNSPKEKCESNGGKWSDSATCEIPECTVGCCILGDSARVLTNRECSLFSEQYSFTKNFVSLDSNGGCSSYTNLDELGACLTPASDYSNQNDCVFGAKKNCGGEFKKGYLCTAKFLNSTCQKSEKTICDGEKIYYLDSCGNKANIYDAGKFSDQNYWEKIIPAGSSCSAGSSSCGNCDYSEGSICASYVSGQNEKPKYGNNVCRNLNCENGRKNGESWCISDYSPDSVAPVGARQYIAKCVEGEISIEGCADFNQEICISSANSSSYSGKNEARCIVNDWRSCISANDKGKNYDDVKEECDKYSQCQMFLEIPENEKYIGLPGFKKNVSNEEQGSAGNIGKTENQSVIWCVPKYTPGLQFWTTSNSIEQTSDGKQQSSASYGGSLEETNAICSLGSFSCVSHIKTETSVAGGTGAVYDAENPECNIDAADSSKQKVSLLMEALNERCKMIGSCGTQANVVGEVGEGGYSVDRIYIDKNGKTNTGYSTDGYNLSESYVSSLGGSSKYKFGNFQTLTMISLTGFGVGSEIVSGARFFTSQTRELFTTGGLKNPASLTDTSSLTSAEIASLSSTSSALSSLPSSAYTNALAKTIPLPPGVTPAPAASSGGFSWAQFGTQLAITAAAMAAAYFIGIMIAKNSGMTPAETTNFIAVVMSGTSVVVSAVFFILGTNWWNGIGLALAIVFFVISVFQTSIDNEYYIVHYQCQAWEAPKEGDCGICNKDVRPCSEYKCKSLGQNCQYFVENGEPGYCASISEIWSAQISPWYEILTEGNKYSSVGMNGFAIEGKTKKEVAPYQPITFGVVTDKQASCKIDLNGSLSYDAMSYQMLSEKNSETGKVDGLHHKIVLSPSVTYSDYENMDGYTGTTLPLEKGENSYYIKCRNFAGQENEAPFVVKVEMGEGYDLTPAIITRTNPEDKTYLAKGTNETQFWIYLNEPAECKYEIEYDEPRYENMTNSFSCLTDANSGYYGEWPCFTTITNLTNPTKIYIKCKDQPGLTETDLQVRNVNGQSYFYSLNVCESGLEIYSTSIQNNQKIEIADANLNLQIQTAGCINNGEAVCGYNFPQFSDEYSKFLNTDANVHSQNLDLETGNYLLNILCYDSAGNSANKTLNFSVYKDISPPNIVRIAKTEKNIQIKTDELAECFYTINNQTICSDALEEYSATPSEKSLIELGEKTRTYYVKCKDEKNNVPNDCSIVIFA